MSVNRPTLLAAAAATISAAGVIAMAGTAFALDSPRPPATAVTSTAPAPAAPSHTVATTPAFAPG